MIKKISVDQLKVGMYIHDLCCDWMSHPFIRKRFKISAEKEIQKIMDAGIHELYIDTGKGIDAKNAPTEKEVLAELELEILKLADRELPKVSRLSFAEEFTRAGQVKNQAHQIVRGLMQDAKLGKAIDLEQIEPVLENVVKSILRNSAALISLLSVKSKDDYTSLHSVSVCTLMVAFCRTMGMDANTIYQAGLGGLLHDTGKALVPDHIMYKAGPLSEAEFALIKRHPRDGYEALLMMPEIGPIPLDITLHHHEREDGSGYPDKLRSRQISQLAQMAAIVDVYDAITTDRSYDKGMSAADALRKIFEWSKFHFNPEYVQSFIRCVGVYPIGTLVLLESGRLGVVMQPHPSNMLAPKVNVFFDTRKNAYIRPEEVDLARPVGMGGGDKIVGHESPAKWRVDPMRFLVLA